MKTKEDQRLDMRARRVAQRVGLRAYRLRGRRHLNNQGGFALVDVNNIVVNGVNFELTADDVFQLATEMMTADRMIPGARRAA